MGAALQCCSGTRRAGASPRGDIGLVCDGRCCGRAVVLVVLVLLLTEASAWLVKGPVVDQPGGRR
jgi:hypothetical protein